MKKNNYSSFQQKQEQEYLYTISDYEESTSTEEIPEIKYKSHTESAIEDSKTKAFINNISTIGTGITDNAEKAFQIGSKIFSNKKIAENIGTGAVAGIATGEFIGAMPHTPEVVQNAQFTGQIISTISTAALAVYVGYKLYENLKNDEAKVVLYNMLEWGRVNIGLKVPKKPHPRFKLINLNFIFINWINKQYEDAVLDCRMIFKDCYSGITLFILGNFIYNIDRVLDEFLSENKRQNFTEAWKEYEFSKSKLKSRQKYLCLEDHYINTCLRVVHKKGVFPNDHGYGNITSEQVDHINNYIQNYCKIFTENRVWIKMSATTFLFKTLQFTFDLLKEDEYKVTDHCKNELIKYVYNKTIEFTADAPYYTSDTHERYVDHKRTEAEKIFFKRYYVNCQECQKEKNHLHI